MCLHVGRRGVQARPDFPEEPPLRLHVGAVVQGAVKKGVIDSARDPEGWKKVVADRDGHEADGALAVEWLQQKPISFAGHKDAIEGPGQVTLPPQEASGLP